MSQDKTSKLSKKSAKPKVLSLIDEPSSKRKAKPPIEKKSEVLDLLEKSTSKKTAKKNKGKRQDSIDGFGKKRIKSDFSQLATGHEKKSLTDIQVDEEEEQDKRVIHLKSPIMIRTLADSMDVKPHKLINDLMSMGIFANITQAIDAEVARRVCQKHGFVFQKEKREKGTGVHKKKKAKLAPSKKPSKLVARPPVITFMGHVDHGKTSLLDYIRKSKVVAKEAGGITQHIGAYQIMHNGKAITFLDTPGHSVFTEMRARGADVTDIVVLVIAADDGVMPQTQEAIDHAKAADVTLMIAVNKCDLKNADPNRVMQQMQKIGLAPEQWGGDTIFVEVSAETGKGVDDLLEMMILQAEMLDLKGELGTSAKATVIESRLESGRGAVATSIVREGILKPGMSFICGDSFGKVKVINNSLGKTLSEARPGDPAEIVGFSDMPNVGDELVVMPNERDVKRISEERKQISRHEKLAQDGKISFEDFLKPSTGGEIKNLNLIIKADVLGSCEAIASALGEYPDNKVKLDILHNSVGAVSESDVLLASASNAFVFAFHVKVDEKAEKIAARESVEIRRYSVIYELLDDVKAVMKGLLEPFFEEKELGKAKILQTFKLARGRAAGCMVESGSASIKARVRVLRGDEIVYEGRLAKLRRFQDEVKEVQKGQECGMRFENYNDYKENDVILFYELVNIEQNID